MAQLFRPRANTVFRVVIVLTVLGLAGLAGAAYLWARSDSAWNVGKPYPQPIPFRHDLHSGELGIACQYCHSSVERAAYAGMPSAQTCLSCHSQVWVGASVLEPLRSSIALNQPIVWSSVNRLPDYAYFHHGAHLSRGVPCATCHGDVETMPKIVRAHTLNMGWCLDCHRNPQAYIPEWQAAADRRWAPHDADLPEDLKGFYQAVAHRLTNCNTCHR